MEEAERRLDAALNELTTAPTKRIPLVNLMVQRWRVAALLLREREDKTVNPKIYNEMSLLNRMAKTVDFDEDETAEEAARLQTAEEKLKAAGVSVQGARAVVEMFSRAQIDEPDTQPNPDPSAGRD